MSVLANYREKEEMLRKLTEDLNRMKENPALQKELDFKEEINTVLEKYGRQASDLVSVFGLNTKTARAASGRGNRTPRRIRVYINPHTNEEVETRGGNHRVLRQWREKYGAEAVNSWFKEERD